MDRYTCYLLQSIPKPKSFYIGCTNDPARRLRQHNGDLKAGGAWKTKKDNKRPWQIMCLVSGFPSRTAALQFEHAWQHPHTTRHIKTEERVSAKLSLSYPIVKRFANLRLLLRASKFRRLPLHVHNLTTDGITCWLTNKYNIEIPNHIRLHEVLDGVTKDTTESNTTRTCPVCHCRLDLIKVAELWLKTEADEILPVSGLCPECHGFIQWSQIANIDYTELDKDGEETS